MYPLQAVLWSFLGLYAHSFTLKNKLNREESLLLTSQTKENKTMPMI